MDYGSTIWGQCGKININRINKLQKRAARIILHKPLSTPSQELFNDLHWMTFEERVNYMTAVLTYKAMNNLAPSYLSNLLVPVSNTLAYGTRSTTNNNLVIPTHNTELFKQSFSYSAVTIWNSIPLSLKETPSLQYFKNKAKLYLTDHN